MREKGHSLLITKTRTDDIAWDGLSKMGATPFRVFNENFKSQHLHVYIEILDGHLLPMTQV